MIARLAFRLSAYVETWRQFRRWRAAATEFDADASLDSDDPIADDWRAMWHQVFQTLEEEDA